MNKKAGIFAYAFWISIGFAIGAFVAMNVFCGGF